jgi:hypothetical protein
MNKHEKLLRENIRQMIRFVKQKRESNEDNLREVIRGFLDIESSLLRTESQTPDVSPTPNKSTGINVLEELLKKVVPVLETDFKSLTTDSDQRQSFRSHIINAVINTLTPAKVNTDAGGDDLQEYTDMDEEIDVVVGDGNEDDKFIDIRTDAERAAAEEPDEEDPRDTFGAGIEGDETGRNMAYQSFKKIESSIIDSYELLSNDEDQELFYDYLIANLKLYFDKFEEELAGSVEEPTNQAYDMAKSDVEQSPEDVALEEYVNSL